MDSLEITKPSLVRPAPVLEGTLSSMSVACCTSGSAMHPRDLMQFWISDRRVLAVAGLALAGAGFTLGWNWLTAVGVAPLIVSAAPCLVMCAVGGCVMCRSNQARSAPGVAPADAPPPVSEG